MSVFAYGLLAWFLLSPFLDTPNGERGVSSPCFPLLDTRYSRAAYLMSHFPISSDAVFDTGWHDMRENTRRAVFFGRDGRSIHRSIQRAWSKGILTCFHKLLAFANPASFRYPSEPDMYIIPEFSKRVDSRRKSVAELLPDDSEQDEGDDEDRRCCHKR